MKTFKAGLKVILLLSSNGTRRALHLYANIDFSEFRKPSKQNVALFLDIGVCTNTSFPKKWMFQGITRTTMYVIGIAGYFS